ncbi:hypothetical protein HTZ97_16230 [Desulfuromonas acetoxidans]|nr:hypothetical protein [Desulfuromonas acetoxidans]MBF0646906.1 hypothetical protein [Desulfuromonas acetoxidans]NVD26183.1 hypothetical protein [Desulfuromonas acetoxidans]NVE18005.1 hypothetical protein [Desulfuromonas acetoxidans]
MASKIVCPKCGAGSASLSVEFDLTVLGRERFIRCSQCGNRVYESQKTVMKMPVPTVKKYRYEPTGVCKVDGCTHPIYANNKSGFCQECGTKQRAAFNKKHLPPFIEVAGEWIKNPLKRTINKHPAQVA